MATPRLVLVLLLALVLSGCTTRAKTYVAPSGAQVEKQTKRLGAAVQKAAATAARAEAKVVQAQAVAGKIAADLETAKKFAADLDRMLPALLANPLTSAIGEVVGSLSGIFGKTVADLKTAIESIAAQEKDLVALLEDAQREQEQLKKDHHEAALAKIDLEVAQTKYKLDAEQLARAATDERNARIAAEKQLFQQKVFGWLWKIGGAVAIVLAFLWFTGRLGIIVAKILA